MAHDVFISYAVEDGQVAEQVCGALEGQGIRCWMAPRDVPYGADYEEAIMDAITASRLLVLILSTHSNASQHVKREIQNACAENSPTEIIPLRIDAVAYSKALRYYLGSVQWLDASTPPLEAHLRRLVEHVRNRLRRSDEETPPPVVTPPKDKPPDERLPPSSTEVIPLPARPPARWRAAAAVALLSLTIVAVIAYRLSGKVASVNDNSVNVNSNNGGTNNAANDGPAVPAAVTPTAKHDSPTPTPQRTPSPTPPKPTPTRIPPAATPTPAGPKTRLPDSIILRKPVPTPTPKRNRRLSINSNVEAPPPAPPKEDKPKEDEPPEDDDKPPGAVRA